MNNDPKGSSVGRTRLTGNLVAQYGLQAAKYIIPFLTLPYLARVLGADSYAVRAYVLSLMTFVNVFLDCGFNLSATKDVVQSRDEMKAVNRVVGSVMLSKAILILTGAIAVAALTWFLPILRDNALYTALAYCAVALNSLCPDFIYIGYERMGPLTTRYIASKTVCLLLTFLLIRSPNELILVPLLDIITSLIAFCWTWVGIKRRFGVRCAFVNPKSSLAALRKSILYFASNASSSVHNSFLTLIIGIAMADQSEVAYWSLMITAITAAQSLYSPIGNALYPHMLARKNMRLMERILLIAIPVVTLGCILFWFMSDLIMLVLGGSEYVGTGSLLQLLTPVLWFSFFGMLFGWPVLGSRNRVRQMTLSTATGALVAIVMSVTLCFAGVLDLWTAVAVRVLSEAVTCGMRAYHALPLILKDSG